MSDTDINNTPEQPGQMTFIDHLEELRSRIIKAAVAVMIGFIATYFFADRVIEFLSEPFLELSGSTLTLLAPTEGFMVRLKTGLLTGLIVSSPAVFYQFWNFIAPGLYQNERRFIIPVVIWSVLLFAIGALFAYQVLPYAMKFFHSFAEGGAENFWSLSKYITFVTYLLLAFGLVFELPLVIYFAARMGLVTPQFLRKYRKHALIILLVLSAMITPPDIFTQAVLAIPLGILYEVSIWLAVIAVKKHRRENPETPSN